MQAVTFYHYQPSGDYVRDGPDDEAENDPQVASIKTLHRLDHVSNHSISDYEDDDDCSNNIDDISMEESELGLIHNPDLIWTPTKYKPQQVAHFISLIQNKNLKVKDAAKEAMIESSAAYKFLKEWKKGGGNTLPGYIPASELKPKQNHLKLTDEHSEFIETYVEEHPTCKGCYKRTLQTIRRLENQSVYYLSSYH
ncbi:hypothetical protein BDA99DRAFT_595733 [Phascolomyces articulosus]|uniref:Uncharacterized protein n=1 Tax=Phascolomyces articulosus TaxID=60185 RepID=A0AAD5P8E4_9FUNG|nr:hypothetical protein BDA99DRAFT_595733 [Phascolomyces articulosus]